MSNSKKYRKFTKRERELRGLDEYRERLRLVRADREARAKELRAAAPTPSAGKFSRNSRRRK